VDLATVQSAGEVAKMIFEAYFIQILTLICVLYLVGSGSLKKFARKFSKVKTPLLELEATNSLEEETASCPHKHCNEARNKTTRRLFEKVDCLTETDKQIFAKLDKITDSVDALCVEMKKTMQLVDELSIDQLKLVFFNTDMPTAERLIGGLRYVARGHNGEVRKQVEKFAADNPTMYEAAVTASPTLRIQQHRSSK